MDKFWQVLWIGSTLFACWWGMLLVHESGHMLAALATGGKVAGWALKPWEITMVQLSANPSPLVVTWGGAVFGAGAPLALAIFCTIMKWRIAPACLFFAGFCLLANGAYLAFGTFGPIGDVGDLFRHGASTWQLWLFGLTAMFLGLSAWHRLGEKFPLPQSLTRINRRNATIASVLAAALFAGMAAFGQQTTAPPERVMIGYYANFGDLKVEDIPWHRLTHLCHAYLKTDDQGKLVTDKTVPSKELTAAARKNGVKVLLSLGGGKTTAGFEQVTADKKALAVYVNDVAKAAVLSGYDGIDVDWEFPRSEEMQQRFTDLVVALRRKLDAVEKAQKGKKRYLLTAEVSPSPYFGKFIEIDQVLGHLDWLHVSTYDFSGPWDRVAAHHAPLLPSRDDPDRAWRAVSLALEYWHQERDVPASKLVVGLSFYGRAFPATKRYQPLERRKKSQHGVLSFRETRTLLDKKWRASWDEDVQAPWMQTPLGKDMIVAYDDRNSIYKKTLWTKQQGYRGVYFMALHQDRMPDGKHWLVEASYKAWPVKR